MEHTTFFEHYRISRSDDESAQEVSRTGAAINYKAIDTRSHEPVQLQLIPVATIEPSKLQQLKERAQTAEKLDHINIAKTFAVGVEDDYLALVSEHFEGETADSWIVEHGPMAADAALRVGLQVVRAIGAAAFFNLTHRAIQPSNLMIAPGQSPDGGWPFVKLLNFGLASLELHSDSSEARELAPTISPQFASPEQRPNEPATPLAQVVRGVVAFAVLILAAGTAAELFFPDKIPFLHRDGKIGTPVGVPDAAKFASAPTPGTNAAPVAANQPTSSTSPAIAAANQNAAPVEQTQSPDPAAAKSVTNPTEIWKQIAA